MLFTAALHIAIAGFLGFYLWAAGYVHATWVYAALVLAYAGYCRKLHPMDTLLIFLVVLLAHILGGVEGFESKSRKTRQPERQDDDDDDAGDDTDADASPKEAFDGAKDAHIDLGTTFLNSYRKLKPDQIASMQADTKELMETQKQLMETLATMGPAVQNGMDMIDSFKTYFGKA